MVLTDNASLIQATPSGVTVATAYMGMESDLLDWNDQDPPDAGEQLRNEVVYSYQHNRNPFIDHPEWARCVFTNTNCPVASGNDFALGTNPTSTLVQDGASTAVVSGTAESVTLSANNLPVGITASLSPATVTAGQSSDADRRSVRAVRDSDHHHHRYCAEQSA